MKREKNIIGVRNRLADLSMWCDSAAAINAAQMSESERSALQQKLRDVVFWIDQRMK